MSLGENIRKYRHDMGMTQEELAGILCVTSQAVSKWESGSGLPDITQVIHLDGCTLRLQYRKLRS